MKLAELIRRVAALPCTHARDAVMALAAADRPRGEQQLAAYEQPDSLDRLRRCQICHHPANGKLFPAAAAWAQAATGQTGVIG